MGLEGVYKGPDWISSWLCGKWSIWTLLFEHLPPFLANENAPEEYPRSCSS